MSKEKSERPKPHVKIGTIGHVDHSKDTLAAAITKVLSKPKKNLSESDSIENYNADDLPGITINPKAYCKTNKKKKKKKK